MSEALAFADAVAARCASALERRPSRSEICRLGRLPFRLIAPTDIAGRWIGSAFLQAGEPSLHGCEDYRLQNLGWGIAGYVATRAALGAHGA